MEQKKFCFSLEKQRAYEDVIIPMAAFQYLDGKIYTIVVSDGLCEYTGKTRVELQDIFDNYMFQYVHRDDIEVLVKLGNRFALKDGDYDIVYRSSLNARDEYRYIHAVAKYKQVENDTEIAFFTYDDITDIDDSTYKINKKINAPKVEFLDKNMGAMSVISKKTHELYYYNHAMTRLIPPRKAYDCGITFEDFFYSGTDGVIRHLFDLTDRGVQVVKEPLTKRLLEVNVLSSIWGDDPVYAVYFYEKSTKDQVLVQESILRHRRLEFHEKMLSGKMNDFLFYEDDASGYIVWNYDTGEFIKSEGSIYNLNISDRCGLQTKETFFEYIKFLAALCRKKEDRNFLEIDVLNLLKKETFDSYKEVRRIIALHTVHGFLAYNIEVSIAKSPDTMDRFVKITETNITSHYITDILIEKAVEQDYDYIAYVDALAKRVRFVNGNMSNEKEKIKSFYLNMDENREEMEKMFPYFGCNFSDIVEMFTYIKERFGKSEEFIHIYELTNKKIKKVIVQRIEEQDDVFMLRCMDVTNLLHAERKRERELKTVNSRLIQAVREEHLKVENVSLQTILSISNALDARDEYTSKHSERVAQYAARIAKTLNWTSRRINNLYHIALVHDIGKIGIPDAILLKKEPLTKEEYELIKKHVEIGSSILKDFTALDKVSEGARYHHERYDGNGYIHGLKGKKIPIEARIIGIADAVDAMNSTRPYRQKQTKEFIKMELVNGKGTQFDPELAELMLALIDDGLLE